jgi:hypothetical protein
MNQVELDEILGRGERRNKILAKADEENIKRFESDVMNSLNPVVSFLGIESSINDPSITLQMSKFIKDDTIIENEFKTSADITGIILKNPSLGEKAKKQFFTFITKSITKYNFSIQQLAYIIYYFQGQQGLESIVDTLMNKLDTQSPPLFKLLNSERFQEKTCSQKLKKDAMEQYASISQDQQKQRIFNKVKELDKLFIRIKLQFNTNYC